MGMAVNFGGTGTQWAGIPYKLDVTTDAIKAGATTAVKATGSSLGKAVFMLDGSWCNGAVKQFTQSLPKNTLANRLKNLFSFDWGNAINNEYVNRAATAVSTSAPRGFFGKIGHFLGKIPGVNFVKKHLGPIVIIATSAPAIYKGFKDGGMLEGCKEIGRTVLQQGAYTAATFIAGAVLGLTGLPLMLAGIGGSILLGMGIDKILGKSLSQQEAEAAKQEKANKGKKTASNGNTLNPAQLEQSMKTFTDLIHERNKADLNLPSMPSYYA